VQSLRRDMAAMRSIELEHDHSDTQDGDLSSSGQLREGRTLCFSHSAER